MYTYTGAHSITFINPSGTERNTWTNWKLIPTQKPVVPMPEFDNNYVEIPGSNGSLDLSDYLTGGPVYRDRSGSFEFYLVDPNIDTAINTIAQFIHGKKLKFVLSDDPNFYYEGRMALSDKRSDAGYPRVTISYRVGPYKINRSSGTPQF